MRESAIVLSTASPSAPPISREVFSRPEASPLWRPGTPCIATIVAGTSEKPMPSAVSTRPRGTYADSSLPPGRDAGQQQHPDGGGQPSRR